MALTVECCRSAFQQRSDSESHPLEECLTVTIKVIKKAKTANHVTVESNNMDDIVHEIDHLTKGQALERIVQLQEVINESYFTMGGVLSKVKAEGWYKPDTTIEEFVGKRYAMSARKARYFVTIYEKLRQLPIGLDVFKGIGWTKMRILVRVLNKENAEAWAKLALKNSKDDLYKLVKAELTTSGSQSSAISNAKHAKVFKFDDEQVGVINAAIEKAKAQSGVKVDAKALEYVCSDFCGGTSLLKRVMACSDEKVSEFMLYAAKRLGSSACAQIFAEAFTDAHSTEEIQEGATIAA